MNIPGMKARAVSRVPQRVREGGLTLVELMVAIAVGIVILLALTTFFARNSSNQQELELTIRRLENARFSLDTLAEDVMHAGYFSDFNPDTLLEAPTYQTPDLCATVPAAQGWDTSASPVRIPVPVQGVAAGATHGCLAHRRPGTEGLVVRRAETTAASPIGTGRPGNLYIQISRCPDGDVPLHAPVPLRVADFPDTDPEATFSLRRPDCSSTNDALRRLVQRTYFIAACNDCQANDGIPTLKRVELIDGALRTTSIAEGAENLQVEYGLDTDNDGRPNRFVTLGSGLIDGTPPNVWQNVVAVRLHLLVRNTQASGGYRDGRTYLLGPEVSVTPPEDGFKRTLLTTTVRLNNVAGRRER